MQALVAERETRFFRKTLVSETVDTLYIGGEGDVEERLVARVGLRFVGIPAGGVHGLAPWRAVWNLTKLMRGWGAAYRLGRRERPGALFVTGGYAGAYEASLIAEFEALLPEAPPWK